MRLTHLPALLLLIALAACSSSSKLSNHPSVLVADDPLTENDLEIVRMGVFLHDQQNFAGAREAYRRVLTARPNSSLVLYQIAYAYSAEGNYRRCVDYASRGAGIRSERRHELLHMQGVCLDMLGRPADAIKAFKLAVAEMPDAHLLHYSLGLTQLKTDALLDAISSFEFAIRHRPEHASSHVALASTNESVNKRFAAFLGYNYFLLLETDTDRSEQVRSAIRRLLAGPEVTSTADGKTTMKLGVDLVLSPDPEMGALELMMGLIGATRSLPEFQDTPEIVQLGSQYDRIIGMAEEFQDRKSSVGLIWEMYVPFFVDIKEAGHLETFVYLTFEQTELEGVDAWLKDNEENVQAFFDWLAEE